MHLESGDFWCWAAGTSRGWVQIKFCFIKKSCPLPGAAESCLSALPWPATACPGPCSRRLARKGCSAASRDEEVRKSFSEGLLLWPNAQTECRPDTKYCKGAKHTEQDNTIRSGLRGKGCHAVTLGALCSFQQHSPSPTFN